MKIETNAGVLIEPVFLQKYFENLVNQFFKILPMRENGEESLQTYMQSLLCELLGCQSLVRNLQSESMYVSLLAILQALIDAPDCPVYNVKREVFKAISLCNKMKDSYTDHDDRKVAE